MVLLLYVAAAPGVYVYDARLTRKRLEQGGPALSPGAKRIVIAAALAPVVLIGLTLIVRIARRAVASGRPPFM